MKRKGICIGVVIHVIHVSYRNNPTTRVHHGVGGWRVAGGEVWVVDDGGGGGVKEWGSHILPT